LAVSSEFRVREAPTVRRCLSRSSLSLRSSAENTEDALPEELAEMRSRMSKLHNIVSTKGETLADYKRSSNGEQNVDDSAFLKDESEYDESEDSCGQAKSSIDSIGKGLRKRKDADVLISMPYGQVRFDSMNRQKSVLQPESEDSDFVNDEVPSVKIVKDGRYVFSVNAVEESEESLEVASEDIMGDETCHVSSQSQTELPDVRENLFEEQYFGDALQQQEEKQGSIAENAAINREVHALKSNIFDEQYFGDVLQHEEQKQTVIQQEDDKQQNSAKGTMSHGKIVDEKPSLFDEQYFSDVLQQEEVREQKETNFMHSGKTKSNLKNSKTGDMRPNIFEEQYLSDEKRQSSQISKSDFVEGARKHTKLDDRAHSGSRPKTDVINGEKLSMIDEQYFGSYVQSESASLQEGDNGKGAFSSSDQMSHSHSMAPDSHSRFRQHSTNMTLSESIATRGHESAPVWKEVEDIIKDSVTDDDNTIVVEPITRRAMKARTRPEADVERPKTAYDLTVKLRQERQQQQSSDAKEQAFGKINHNKNHAMVSFCVLVLKMIRVMIQTQFRHLVCSLMCA